MLLMKLEDFNYELPKELIAQTPRKNRDSSKLLVMDRDTGKITHQHFSDLTKLLVPNDILVINNTKVIPARLIGEKEDTHATIELLLLKELEDNVWECLSRPFKRLKNKTRLTFGNGKLKAEVIAKKTEGIVHVRFIYEGIFLEILDQLGKMPLPPYIHQELAEKDRYNTVYAQNIGSAAAPTAGLHFTKELLSQLKDNQIKIVEVTLHVGLGTFRPVETEDILSHHMHSEYYELKEEEANILKEAKQKGHRIIAVGTTSTRVLETIYQKYQTFQSCSGYTDIFIYPGYQFQAIDCLITNFHLPKSTLVMLVSAFSKREYILNAYQEAIQNGYYFFSFGDAMFLKKEPKLH